MAKLCSGSVWGGRMGLLPCVAKAKVERDGKPYCGMHDPVRVKERHAARAEARREAQDARDLRWKKADELKAEMQRRYDCHDALVEALKELRSMHRVVLEVNCKCDDAFIASNLSKADAALALAGETP